MSVFTWPFSERNVLLTVHFQTKNPLTRPWVGQLQAPSTVVPHILHLFTWGRDGHLLHQ